MDQNGRHGYVAAPNEALQSIEMPPLQRFCMGPCRHVIKANKTQNSGASFFGNTSSFRTRKKYSDYCVRLFSNSQFNPSEKSYSNESFVVNEKGSNSKSREEETPEDLNTLQRPKAARHNVKHRVAEKTNLKAVEETVEDVVRHKASRVPEQLVKETAQTGAERVARSVASRAGSVVVEKKMGRVASRELNVLEEVGKEALDHAAVKAAAAKSANQACEKAVERAVTSGGFHHAEQVADEVAIHSVESLSGKSLERAGAQATKNVGGIVAEKSLEQTSGIVEKLLGRCKTVFRGAAVEHTIENTVGRGAETASGHGVEKLASQIGRSHAVESATERSLTRSSAGAVDRVIEGAGRQAAEDAVSQVGSHGMKSAAERAMERSPSRIARVLERFHIPIVRLGRRVLIAIPLFGSILAAHVCVEDYRRSREELRLRPPNKKASFWFRLAAVCDGIDAGTHCFMCLGLANGWEHHILVTGEYVSMGAAAASIACAVQGELLSTRNSSSHA